MMGRTGLCLCAKHGARAGQGGSGEGGVAQELGVGEVRLAVFDGDEDEDEDGGRVN